MKNYIAQTGIFLVLMGCGMSEPLLAQMENLHFKSATIGELDQYSDRYRVVRTIPDGFNIIEEGRAWKNGGYWRRKTKNAPWRNPENSVLLAIVTQSDDKQCELYYDFFSLDPRFLLSDSLYTRTATGFYTQKSLAHREFMMSSVQVVLHGRDDFKFEDYVTVIGGQMPRKYFNADSVFFWNFPIEPTELDTETYTTCTYMYIQRRERVGLVFAWFFTDEGKKREWYYIDQLKKHVWYIDE